MNYYFYYILFLDLSMESLLPNTFGLKNNNSFLVTWWAFFFLVHGEGHDVFESIASISRKKFITFFVFLFIFTWGGYHWQLSFQVM